MRLRNLIVALLGLLVLTTTACQRIEGPVRGNLPVAQLPSTKQIPLELGELVAVTTVPSMEKTVHLWFVKPDQTISIVGMNVVTQQLGPSVLTIERH